MAASPVDHTLPSKILLCQSRQGGTMTARDELLALALLLTLAALLYLVTWLIEGRPLFQEEPAAILSYLKQEQALITGLIEEQA